jgi:hypothetical protein
LDNTFIKDGLKNIRTVGYLSKYVNVRKYIVMQNKQKYPIITNDGKYIKGDLVEKIYFKDINIIFKLESIIIIKRNTGNLYRYSLNSQTKSRTVFNMNTDEIKPKFTIIAIELVEPIDLTIPLQLSEKISNNEAQQRVLNAILNVDETFPKILKECNAMITGSCLLQAIHNIDYNTDMDIFCSTDSVFYLQNCLSKLLAPEPMIIKQFISFKNSKYSMKRIQCVMDLDFKGKLIQIIAINTKDISTYIDNYFDFSFCKIRSDGTNIYPSDLTDICNKTGTFELTSNNHKIKIERCNK